MVSEEGARTVVVLPFQVRGSDRLAYLAEGMVDLLSTDLARGGVLETVDPNDLMAALAIAPERPLDPDRARELSAQFGTGLYILGSVFEVEGSVRLTASLYERSRGGRPVSTHTVEGAVADVLPLVARLAAQLNEAVPARTRGSGVRLVWAGDTVNVLGSPSPDGRMLTFTDWFTGDLAVRDLTAGTNRRITDKGGWHLSVEFAEFSVLSPDARLIAYAWLNERVEYELRVIRTDGSDARVLLTADSGWIQPYGWKRDGSAVLVGYWDARGGRLLWVAVADGAVDTAGTVHPGSGRFRLSPDERWLAYDMSAPDDPRQREIRIRASDGGHDAVVLRSPASNALLAWFPDGRHLLFWSDRGAEPAVWALPVAEGRAAGEPVLVRSGMGWLEPLGFAGDDFLYAVSASERQVHAVTLDLERGAVLEPAAPAIHSAAHSSGWPAWSPDGGRIAYITERPGAQPLTSAVAVRELTTGAVTEYPVLLNSPQVMQWTAADALLVWGAGPRGGPLHHELNLQTGALTAYETGQTQGESPQRSFTVTRDGRTQYFYRWTGDVAYIRRDVASGRETVLLRSGGAGPLALSPDERQLAFVGPGARGNIELYVLPASGGEPRLVQAWPSANNTGIRSIAWSRDGRHLVYSLGFGDEKRAELRRLRLSDGDDRLLMAVSGWNLSRIVAHPDGQRFAFTTGELRQEVWALERPGDILRPGGAARRPF